MALTFTRRFSTPDDLTGDDYGGVAFGLRAVGGKDVIVPEGWDQTAAAVLASKYFRRAGVPLATDARFPSESGLPAWLQPRQPTVATRFAGETDARQVFHRLAGCWTYWGWRLGYFATEADARVYFAEMKAILAKQVWAPNSPQFFNSGLAWAYGITGEDVGQWADREMFQEAATGRVTMAGEAAPAGAAYYRPAPSACFILGVEDSLLDAGGIYDALTAEARIFKFGGGAGANFSKLRGAGEPLTGGGKSSGMMSFLDVFDAGGGTIKSGGISRRAAKIVVCDIDHPDVEQFISWKAHEEYRAACTAAGDQLIRRLAAGGEAARDAELIPPGTRKRLRLAGQFATAPHWPEKPYTVDFDDPHSVYARAGGQNSNNSVRLPDAFLRAVKHDYQWTLIRRTDGAVAKELPARSLWDRVVSACWTSGDPGVHFSTTINEWHTCPEDGEIRASNPCCTVGGTLVDTSEGRIRIDELVRMSEAGEELPFAYCRDVEAGRPTVRRIVRGWKSGEVRKLIRVTTDKGVVVECTPDHRWLTFAGGWVMAKHLRVGTSLRKIARHRNPERRNAVMIADRTAGTSSGAEYQHRWLWREVHGRIADGCDIHHRDEDPTNDRLSNLDERDQHSHRSEHTAGTNNPNAVDVTVEALAAVWSQVRTKTPSGWNGHIRRNGLVGKIPQAQSPTIGGKVRGKPWAEFAAEMDAVLAAANDRVVRIEEVEYADPVPVYDIEVEGTHNFGVSSSADPGTHSLVIHNSEYVFLDDTACNLGSVRLTAFSGWDGGPTFDAVGYDHACRLATITLDVTVGMAAYPTEKICQGSINYRTLGLGYCDLGSLLMRWGMGYDSDAGRATAAALTCLMHLTAVRTSQELAAELAPFPRYEANRAHVKRVMTNHLIFACRVAGLKTKDYVGIVPPPDVDPTHVPECLYLPLGAVAVTMSETVGRPLRNAQLSLCAPTGTIGLLMGCDTTGVEPDFSLVKTKQLVGGGYMQLVNQAVVPALRAMGLSPSAVEEIGRHVYGTRQVPAEAVALIHAHCGSAAEAEIVAAANTGLRAHGDLERAVREADAMGDLAWDRLFPATPFNPGWRAVPGFRPLASLLAFDIDVAAAVALADDWQAEAGGRGTVDDCDLLTDGQKAVFDCATAARPGGRCLTPAAHIDMMAAVQPALSGAISKTVNLPADASPEDVRAALWRAWEKRTKCVAVYVDGQKLSQPLMSGDGTGGTAGVLVQGGLPEAADPEPMAFDATDLDDADYADGEGPEAEAPRPSRRLLPTRRSGVTQKFRLGGQKFYLRTGEYPDGTLGEIFLDMAMEGSAFRALGNAMAVAVSLGLQHGVPLEEYVEAFVGMRFEPAGVLQGHDRIKMAASFLDAIFKDLAIHYLGRDELAHVQPEPAAARPPAPRLFGLDQLEAVRDGTFPNGINPKGPPVTSAPQPFAGPEPATAEWAVWDGSPDADPVPVAGPVAPPRPAGASTGNLCPQCQNFALRRTGTCQTCESCFWNSGCS